MKVLFNKLVSLFMAAVFFLLCNIPFFQKQYGRETIVDVSYGEQVRQKYDIVFPSKAKSVKEKDVGLLLYVHGGGWTTGDKEWHSSRIDLYSKLGIVCAATNYRFTNENVDCFDMLDDITSAIKSIVELGKEKGFNINRVMLTGYSAGAHLSLMYAYTQKEVCPIDIVAVAARSCPTDFTSDFYYTKSALGTTEEICNLLSNVSNHKFTYDKIDEARESLLKISPINYVTKDCVPTLIAHGKLDDIIDISQADELDKALTENHVKHIYTVFPDSGHALDNNPKQQKIEETFFVYYMLKYLLQ